MGRSRRGRRVPSELIDAPALPAGSILGEVSEGAVTQAPAEEIERVYLELV
jgi:hypothetical protein